MVVDWLPMEWWRLQTSYIFIQLSAELDSDSNDPVGITDVVEGSTPKHQVTLRSMMDLSHKLSFDLWINYVDELKRTSYSVPQPVSDYSSLNARLAWQPMEKLELSLVGQNLLDNRHNEFVGENLLITTEVERSIYGLVRWDF